MRNAIFVVVHLDLKGAGEGGQGDYLFFSRIVRAIGLRNGWLACFTDLAVFFLPVAALIATERPGNSNSAKVCDTQLLFLPSFSCLQWFQNEKS
jgi:hypothetical protein